MTGGETEHAMNASIAVSPSNAPSSLDVAFSFGKGRRYAREAAAVALALAIHGGISLVRASAPDASEVSTITEVDLPPAAPPDLPPEPQKIPEPKAEEAAPTKAAAAVQAPQAARAGALVTAKEEAPSAKQSEVVDFVTDPSGTSYGSGVVARGGTADRGVRGATAAGVATGAPRAVGSGPPQDGALVDAANLSRRAELAEANACAGYYPSDANADSGLVTVAVVVRANGAAASVAVVSENPVGQGFGKAARACLQSQRFVPALDRAGGAVAAATTIRLRFVR